LDFKQIVALFWVISSLAAKLGTRRFPSERITHAEWLKDFSALLSLTPFSFTLLAHGQAQNFF
jgi:hypothetical protein